MPRLPRALAAAALVAATAGGATAASAPPPFVGGITHLSAQARQRMTPSVWRPGCPVGLGQLRAVRVTRWDFGHRARRGVVVVRADVAPRVLSVFRALYAGEFPIRRMQPVEAYGGDDYRSIEADNTSAFNCRPATGSTHWSQHAYGLAIDVNPIENPYVSGGHTSHPASVPYLDRSRLRPGMAVEGGVLVNAFAAIGWGWGGHWSSPTDLQHFSSSGT
ncbi:MAG: M15 family metallopeptidase [Thermoleophilia bacterium]